MGYENDVVSLDLAWVLGIAIWWFIALVVLVVIVILLKKNKQL